MKPGRFFCLDVWCSTSAVAAVTWAEMSRRWSCSILNVSSRCWTCMFFVFENDSEAASLKRAPFLRWSGVITLWSCFNSPNAMTSLFSYIENDDMVWVLKTSMSRVAVWKYQVGEVKREVGTAETGVLPRNPRRQLVGLWRKDFLQKTYQKACATIFFWYLRWFHGKNQLISVDVWCFLFGMIWLFFGDSFSTAPQGPENPPANFITNGNPGKNFQKDVDF